jgi:hypothetical protein
VVDSILKNTVAESSVAAREARAKTVRSLGAQWIFRYGMVLGLVALVVVTAILDPSFLMTNNLLNLLRQWAPPA